MCEQPVWKVGRCIRRHTFCQQRQKVCKKRRLNLRFKDPLARPVPFRPLGCVPHGWECFARGFKCRIIPAMALILQNIRCMFLMFSCRRGHRPLRRLEETFRPVRTAGRCPHRPLRKKYAPPTFHTVSGSGAGGETIQSLGLVLQISRLSTKKEVQKPYGFWRAFGYFSRVGKVPRRRQDKPIQLPFPPKKQSRTSHALLCSSHASSQNIEPQHHDAEDNQHNPRRAVERLRRGLIRKHRRDPRPEEREHHAQRQHRPVRRAADGEV